MRAKVLFIDDEPEVLSGFEQNLRKSNFDVVTSSCVSSAFDILKSESIDIVVSDERMPKMSGHEFLTKVYNLYPKTVRILLSGQAELKDVARAINDGQIFRYLAKPIRSNELKSTLNEAINLSQLLRTKSSNLYHASDYLKNASQLESTCPGILEVHRDEDGRILLDASEYEESIYFKEYGICDAIEEQHLTLHYQPQLDPETDKVISYEALVRWQHPEKGLVMPNDFIHLAEQSDDIIFLGRWVLKSACEQLEKWVVEGNANAKVSVNVSARQLEHPDFLSDLIDIIENHSILPNQLELEITEHYALKNLEETSKLLHQIRDVGVRVAIDDFGTGYCTLSYLHELPIDVLKIDKSFIQNIQANVQSQRLVMSLINLGHSLDIDIVAEGVETKAQADLLRSWGCDFLQGYYYSPPVPIEKLLH